MEMQVGNLSFSSPFISILPSSCASLSESEQMCLRLFVSPVPFSLESVKFHEYVVGKISDLTELKTGVAQVNFQNYPRRLFSSQIGNC